jgi:hypothetical protein
MSIEGRASDEGPNVATTEWKVGRMEMEEGEVKKDGEMQ